MHDITIGMIFAAIIGGSMAAALLVVGIQLYQYVQREREAREQAQRMKELAAGTIPMPPEVELTPRERAIARSHVVKHQKRKARQRKAARRQS